jgi:hypothetical protein
MSLALVALSPTDFQTIYDHLTTHKPPYRNMHLREACQRNGKRDLRYLHAMHANRGAPEIEGMVSGPGVFWHYKIVNARIRTQLNVLVETASPKAKARMLRRFLAEINGRIQQETAGSQYFPTRTPGQLYLRRKRPGTSATHPHCTQAVAQQVLDGRFVSSLAAWELELLRP